MTPETRLKIEEQIRLAFPGAASFEWRVDDRYSVVSAYFGENHGFTVRFGPHGHLSYDSVAFAAPGYPEYKSTRPFAWWTLADFPQAIAALADYARGRAVEFDRRAAELRVALGGES